MIQLCDENMIDTWVSLNYMKIRRVKIKWSNNVTWNEIRGKLHERLEITYYNHLNLVRSRDKKWKNLLLWLIYMSKSNFELSKHTWIGERIRLFRKNIKIIKFLKYEMWIEQKLKIKLLW
jgi:hypothetical protein